MMNLTEKVEKSESCAHFRGICVIGGYAPIDCEHCKQYKERGIYTKYEVRKIISGDIVEECFVLRPQKDLAARDALLKYAQTTKNSALAQDIMTWIKSIDKNSDY